MINKLKEHILKQELQELEYKIVRHCALSVRKAELETNHSNIFKRLWNHLESKEVVPEFHLLSKQLPAIDARVQEIKGQLKD